MKGLFITDHALKRFRDHWPDSRGLSPTKLLYILKPRLRSALREGKRVETPGGTYVPITFEGRDGYAVLQALQVVTFAPLEWCEEVSKQRNFF